MNGRGKKSQHRKQSRSSPFQEAKGGKGGIQSPEAAQTKQCEGSRAYSQVIQHIGHVAAVVQGISIGALGVGNLALALQNISKVTPCCQEEKAVFRTRDYPIRGSTVSEHQEGPWGGEKTHHTVLFFHLETHTHTRAHTHPSSLQHAVSSRRNDDMPTAQHSSLPSPECPIHVGKRHLGCDFFRGSPKP